MKTNIERVDGNWDLGFALDKQVASSTYIGDDDNGNPQFNTIRTEIGEALYQLKYKFDFSKVDVLATEIVKVVESNFGPIDVVIPMTPSKPRQSQPVFEIGKSVAKKLNKKYSEDTLVKSTPTKQMKDIESKEEKISTLQGTIRAIPNLDPGPIDILIIDDIFSSGSSLKVACSVLRAYPAVRKIYVIVISRTKS